MSSTERLEYCVSTLQIVDFRSQELSAIVLRAQLSSDIDEAVNRRLVEEGANQLLVDRMTAGIRETWSPDDMQMDALAPETDNDLGSTRLAITSRRKLPTGGLSRLGLFTVVGYRVGGSSNNIKAINCSPALAHTVNAMARWREENAADQMD